MRLQHALPLVLIGVLAFAPPAAGQEVGGAPASSRRAKPESWERRFATALKPNPIGVKLRVSVTETELTGSTRSDVMRQLSPARPEARLDSDGARTPMSFHWHLSWKWEPQVHLSRCQFKAVTVVIESAVDLPRLAGAAASDSATRVWWEEFVEQQFEQRVQVLKVIRDGGRDFYKQVRDLDANTCSALTMRAGDIGREAYADLNERALQTHAAARQMGAPESPPRTDPTHAMNSGLSAQRP